MLTSSQLADNIEDTDIGYLQTLHSRTVHQDPRDHCHSTPSTIYSSCNVKVRVSFKIV